MLWYLDSVDKASSEFLLASESKTLGVVLFIFAFSFNRARIVFPIIATGVIGYFWFNTMLAYNGFLPLTEELAT